jgi:murein DD-endopeptidase MepM/ murein hydrolase activator NlpD
MEKTKTKLIHRLKNKYRIVLINDTTYEEKFSYSLTPINVFIGFSSFLVFFATILVMLIVFTPLREYIPGYTDTQTKHKVERLVFQTDSLEKALTDKESYYRNMLNIMNDKVDERDTAVVPVDKKSSDVSLEKKYILDEQFKKEFEDLAKDNFSVENEQGKTPTLENMNFFTPVEGIVSNAFDFSNDHFAVDVVTKPNEPVKSILEGRVVISSWTPETGNILAIQHKNNVISVYKHNSVLLKKVGTFVNAGDAIAIVGNSGELSTGPHLHLEIWENGTPVNPEQFINF